jgi:hypothetical protein
MTDPRSSTARSVRWWHLVTCAVGLFGLGVQAWISATHALAYDGHVFSAPMRLFNMLSYFTIWSNILVTVIAGLLYRDLRRRGPVFTVLHLDSLIMITVTGLVYALVLAPIWNPTGWTKVADQTLHYAVPALAVLSYLFAGPRPRFTVGSLLRALALPLGWVLYTMIRSPFIRYRADGVIKHWWPYHFINVDDLGYAQVLLNILGVAVLLLAVGGIFVYLDRIVPPKPTGPRT